MKKLFVVRSDVKNNKGWCVLVHGLGEHCGRYEKLSKRLEEEGFAVLRFDLPGHGKSEGRRGDIEFFGDYLQAIEEAASNLNKKFHLIGHSLGGLIALAFAMENPAVLKSVVASAPLLGLKFKPPRFKLLAGNLLYRIFPLASFSNEIDPYKLSRDRNVVEAYISDPLVHRKITVRWFFETMKAMEEVRSHPERLKVPAFLIHGSADELTDPSATQKFYEELRCEKKLSIYEGYYHEPFNEINNERVFQELVEWLKRFEDG